MVWLSIVLFVATTVFVLALLFSGWIMMEGEGEPWVMLAFLASMFLVLAVFKAVSYLNQAGVY